MMHQHPVPLGQLLRFNIIQCATPKLPAFPCCSDTKIVAATGSSVVSFEPESLSSAAGRRRSLMTPSGSTNRRRFRYHPRGKREPPRRLSTDDTSAIVVVSAQFSINGRPSGAVEAGITSIRLTNTDDGSVSTPILIHRPTDSLNICPLRVTRAIL